MREAEWTVSEDAEIARDLREGFVLSKEFFRRAKLQTLAVGVGLAIFGVAIAGTAMSPTFGALAFVFLTIAFLSLGSIPLAHHWEKRQEARHETEPEMRAALGHDGHLVSLIVRQGDAPTGEDRGVLWYENGRLYFAGRRTSFGLVPDQARGFATLEEPATGVRHRLNLVLHRESATGPMSLSFAPFVPSLSNPDVAVGALRMDLDRWKNGRAYGEGQWPPATLGPCVVSERKLLARALATSLLGPIFPAGILLIVAAPLVSLVAFALGTIVFSLAPGNALVWRAWWARRRLRRLR